MANWWNDNKVLLKRSWRYEAYFGMKTQISNNDATVYDIALGQYTINDTQTDIQPFLIHSFEKPKAKTSVYDFGGVNPLNGIIKYNVENFIWSDVTIKIYDSFTKGKDKSQNPASDVMTWLRNNGYIGNVKWHWRSKIY